MVRVHFFNRTIPSKENIEGLPNVLIEAASRGKPIITGTNGGSQEAIEHGVSGYVTDGNDTGKNAEHIIIEFIGDQNKGRRFGLEENRRCLMNLLKKE